MRPYIGFKTFYAMATEDDLPNEGKNKGESWKDGFKRRVVKTTKPEHKEKGYNWRI